MTTANNTNNNDALNYSPFDCLVWAEQTQSGLLQRDDSSEVDVLVMQPIELRALNTDGEPMVPLNAQHQVDVPKMNLPWIDRTSHLMMQLTTHRTVFWRADNKNGNNNNNNRTCRYLHHSQLLQLNTESTGYFKKSPKLILQTAALGELCFVFPKDGTKQRDDCFQAYQKVVSRRGWEAAKTTALTSTTTVAPRRRVGLDAILTTSAMRHQQASHLAETAFQGDAELLLQEAQGLVQIIQQYVATLERQQEFSTLADNNNNNQETQQLVGMLQNMGMTSALSLQGKAYHTQLARELGDFIRPKLTPTNPVMTLTEVYCLYNRARGSNFLSPDDFRAAAEQCNQLPQLGISVTTLPSGLVVLQDDQQADPARLQKRFLQLLQDYALLSLTATDVSRYWRISVVLALEQLKVVEQCGYWVRDETLESLRFHPNRYFC